MKIIDLKRRRKSLYGVEFDIPIDPERYGAESDPTGLIALDIATCDELFIKVGQELDEQKLEEIVYRSHYNRAKQRALWYLDRRDYFKKELLQKLSASFPKEPSREAVERLAELGLVDDRRYAEVMANSLIFNKKVSPKMAKYTLVQKGVDRALADEAVDKIAVDNLSVIREIVERRFAGKLNNEKELNRAISFLARKGFSFSEIKTVLEEFKADLYSFED